VTLDECTRETVNAKATDHLDLYASFGYTDSRIDQMEDPKVVGKQAPLVSRATVNAGVQVHQPVGNGLNAVARVDYQQIGRTWWEPYNVTSRDPVNLVDLRAGVDAGEIVNQAPGYEAELHTVRRHGLHTS